MCDIKSPLSAKSPIYSDDIFKLNTLCLNSFIMAFASVKPKTYFICDNCPEDKYRELLGNFPFEKEMVFTNVGINDTMLMAYDKALESGESTLFAECDYLWLPQSGEKFVNALEHFKVLSPYDHKNFYVDHSIHSKKTEIELFEDHHYRTTERNTMTFGTTPEVLEKNIDSLKRWGYLDADVWKELLVAGYPLWTPLPAFATHMVADWLAPGIDWERLWEFYGEPKSSRI